MPIYKEEVFLLHYLADRLNLGPFLIQYTNEIDLEFLSYFHKFEASNNSETLLSLKFFLFIQLKFYRPPTFLASLTVTYVAEQSPVWRKTRNREYFPQSFQCYRLIYLYIYFYTQFSKRDTAWQRHWIASCDLFCFQGRVPVCC